ncbi:N-acetylmuramoyl-L-alanine amidase [Marinicella rhabdoformis]|uniref:N-acetylmuramoyl-L-alanine amidase n=1 Tax=Marinicella rhabdoformis TaxID=2580566 RepID=UPI0012AEBF6F|nr:N-acetylmuramoyl-L-alanine amidase [Marinicella rhabdoformis]
MKIKLNPLPYQSFLDKRQAQEIELLVIHCTELPDLALARTYGERVLYPSGTGNSGHYYIDRDGSVSCWVFPEYVAHHVANHNKNSIGIELVNVGRYPNWFDSKSQTPTEQYTQAQITALNQLINWLTNRFTELKHIVGHQDLDQRLITASDDPNKQVHRKIDPGPLFPWNQVMPQTTLINIGSNAQHPPINEKQS